MNWKTVEWNGRTRRLSYQWIGDVLWLHLDGETWSVAPSPKRRGKSASAEADSGDILAPMPGKVTRILTKAGDKVQKGQILIVMEAMKMEYNLKAPQDMSVVDVKAVVGEQVQLGHVLVVGKVGE